MDYHASGAAGGVRQAETDDRRGSTRYISLIRAAKIVSEQGEFVCVIRDVSETGISLRAFHKIPETDRQELVLQNGDRYELDRVRIADNQASFTFPRPVNVDKLIVETGIYPKRPLRVSVCVPARLATGNQRFNAVMHNISQHGALIECDAMLAIAQSLILESRDLPDIRTKVRWRREENYGLAFDDTFTLREFALKVAALQCPALLGQ